MFTLLAKFQKLGWNKRILTEADFYRICQRERIKVIEMLLLVPGFYMTCKGRAFICIDSRLRSVRWLHVAFHELAHHFLHAPANAASASFFQINEAPKVLFEAEAFAVVALIPETLLRSMLTGEIEEMHGYPREMLEFRLKVLELYGV